MRWLFLSLALLALTACESACSERTLPRLAAGGTVTWNESIAAAAKMSAEYVYKIPVSDQKTKNKLVMQAVAEKRMLIVELWHRAIVGDKNSSYNPALWAGDINGDGLTDYFWWVGCDIDDSGQLTSYDGTAGMSLIILLGQKSGGYKIIDRSGGPITSPSVLNTKHAGLPDLREIVHTSANEFSSCCLVFNGSTYIPVPEKD